MADKFVTSFRFTEENKKKEILNSVFTEFIICRLTETTISKSRDVWRQSGETVSFGVMDSAQCFLHAIDTKQLLMRCREVQQFTGSKKYRYCTLPRETDGSTKESDSTRAVQTLLLTWPSTHDTPAFVSWPLFVKCPELAACPTDTSRRSRLCCDGGTVKSHEVTSPHLC